MCKVIRLLDFADDRKYAKRIRGIRSSKVLDAHLYLTLDTDGYLPDTWLTTLKWRVTHVRSGRKATANSPAIKVLRRNLSGIILDVFPIFPALGHLESFEQFRLDIWTRTGRHLWFLNEPAAGHEKVAAQPERRTVRRSPRTRPAHLKLVR